MFDMVRYGNAKQDLGTGLKIAVPFKKQEVCRNLSVMCPFTGQALMSLPAYGEAADSGRGSTATPSLSFQALLWT